MQPKSDDPAQQQSNAILKVLPFMIGWFSLSVPAALCVYWFANNIITTATSLFIRNSMKMEPVVTGGGGSSAVAETKSTIFAPPREKPSGFAAPSYSPDEVKPLTAMDAEVVSEDDSSDDDDDNDGDSAASGDSQPKSPGKKRGKKRRKNKN